MSRFHNYSFNNTLLIAMQKPDASLVAGFSSWKNTHGRNVKRGEKGIKILAPSPYKIRREMEKIDPQTQQPVIGKDGKPVTEEREITIPAYKVVSVFDVSQTEGRELPDIAVDELAGDVDRYKDFFAALEKTSPVPIGFENIEGKSHGYYHLEEKRIAIQEGMSELQTLKTAIHEIAHAKLHDIDLNAPKEDLADRPDRRTREVQAESVAYTVCQHYGLDTSDYSFGYVAGWSSGRELAELKASLETIRTAAAEIIDSIDGHFAELQQAREQTAQQEQPQPGFEQWSEPADPDNGPDNPGEPSDDVAAYLPEQDKPPQEAAPDLAAEPTVTIIWSESAGLREGETMPLSRANALFASLDEAELASPGYDKTKFAIDCVFDGEADHYEGRQDFGDGDGSLIDHIEKYHAHYENNADWENHLLHTEGNGFRWSPKEGAWQRQLTTNAYYAADYVKAIAPITGEKPTELQRAHIRAQKQQAVQTPQEQPAAEAPAPEQAQPQTQDTFSIYQLKRGDETRDFRFEPYDRLQAAGLAVDPANYDLIYTAPLAPDMSLDDIFTRFNIDHPADFKGHSLSVSDVVVLHQAGQDTAHYVDSIGYQQVPEFLREQQELTPDARMTGEQIKTPRGSFRVTDMTREQMEAAGYGFHHQSEDGKYFIMGNGTRAFAVAATQPESPIKHIEDAVEQNDNSFDGIINNTPPPPTVDELEAKVQAGEQISLLDLADAIKADKERGGGTPEKKPSIRAQLKADKERAAQKKTAAKTKSQDLERS
jgi:antirestriction protein ArdC